MFALETVPPQAHVSAPDHKRDKTYVRTGNGFTTLTTSPLIHVQEADNRMLAFVAPDIPREKDATPPIVDTVVDPKRDTEIGVPLEPLTEERTLTVHETGGEDVSTFPVAPFTN